MPPPGLPLHLREACDDADPRPVLYVARARFRDGTPPWDLADRLAAVAQDERVTVRTRRVAAELVMRLRRAAWERQRAGLDYGPCRWSTYRPGRPVSTVAIY